MFWNELDVMLITFWNELEGVTEYSVARAFTAGTVADELMPKAVSASAARDLKIEKTRIKLNKQNMFYCSFIKLIIIGLRLVQNV
jgi:hypothetical protein